MLLLKNCKIYTQKNNAIVYGDILINNSKIINISSDINKSDINEFDGEIIDLCGKSVTPGFIDCSTSIGLVTPGIRYSDAEASEKFETVSCNLKTRDGINYTEEDFKEAAMSGVTTVIVNSGKQNVIGSISCAVKTLGKSFEDAIISDEVDINCVIADYPKKWNINRQESPLSRMGIVNVLRENLYKAKQYSEKKENNQIDFNNYDSKLELLSKVIKKELPLKILCNKVQDIQKALEIKKEFNINIIINSAAECYMLSKEISESKTPVILPACLDDNSSDELENRREDSLKVMAENNILTAIGTNHPEVIVKLLHLGGCIYAKFGAKDEDVLNSLTINAARILGLDNRIGSIEIGKDADLAIFDGEPLHSMSKVVMTIIDGRIVYKS